MRHKKEREREREGGRKEHSDYDSVCSVPSIPLLTNIQVIRVKEHRGIDKMVREWQLLDIQMS